MARWALDLTFDFAPEVMLFQLELVFVVHV
jgi:hypothetical protein